MMFTFQSDEDIDMLQAIFRVTVGVLEDDENLYLIGPNGEMLRVGNEIDEEDNLTLKWQDLQQC